MNAMETGGSEVAPCAPFAPPAEVDAKPRLSMCGANRRRFNKLIRQGFNEDEAQDLILKESKENEKLPNKRQRSEEGTPEQKKKAKTEEGRPEGMSVDAQKCDPETTFAVALTQKEVAICSAEYPQNPLTTEIMDEIQDLLLDKIVELRHSSVKPQFNNSIYKAGYMTLVCKDEATRNWIMKVIPTIAPSGGGKMQAMDEANMPHPLRAVAYLPNGARHKSDRILHLLEGQNDGYNFSAWRVLKRINRHTNAMIVWAIDQQSGNKITENGKKLYFGYKDVTFHLKSEDQTSEEKLIEELNSFEITE